MSEILGTPTSLSMRVSRKLGDKFFGSGEASAELTVDLPKGVNIDDAFDALDAWLTAQVAESINEKRKEWEKWFALQPADYWESGPPETPQYGIGDHRAVPPPGPTNFPETGDYTPQNDASVPVKAPVAPVAGSGAVETHEILENCTISHQVTGSGIHHLLVKGGKYKKYGVRLWPEKASELIESEWQEWPIGEEHSLPDGYTEAVVQMKTDGKPDRVVGLR